MEKLEELFWTKKPIIGMIHLAGKDSKERIRIALKEMEIYRDEGVSGAIVEDYHGSASDAIDVMSAISKKDFGVVLGVNVLSRPSSSAYVSNVFSGEFVQFDSVQGEVFSPNWNMYNQFIMGGVGFKYQPKSKNSLDYDLNEGMKRCDAIVTTGEGTGMETPIKKLIEYKKILKDFPLIVGAGVTPSNVYEQLKVADGAIVGSWFKPKGNTEKMVERGLVRELMDVVREVR